MVEVPGDLAVPLSPGRAKFAALPRLMACGLIIDDGWLLAPALAVAVVVAVVVVFVLVDEDEDAPGEVLPLRAMNPNDLATTGVLLPSNVSSSSWSSSSSSVAEVWLLLLLLHRIACGRLLRDVVVVVVSPVREGSGDLDGEEARPGGPPVGLESSSCI